MSTCITVCNGCCCGRVEKGHSEVPLKALKTAWKERGLGKSVKLTISDCLGPCSMHNVTLLKTEKGQTWLGKLSSDEHYDALLEWAHNVAHYGVEDELPDILVQRQFDRNKIE